MATNYSKLPQWRKDEINKRRREIRELKRLGKWPQKKAVAVKPSRRLPAKPKEKKLVNHVIFVIDESASMSRYPDVKGVFDRMVRDFATSQGNQETLGSTFKFSSGVKRGQRNAPIGSLTLNQFHPNGMTALVDAIYYAIMDHVDDVHPENESHSYLLYVITDGEENASTTSFSKLSHAISKLDGTWTLGALVPDARAVHNMRKIAIPAGNITTWNVNSTSGFEEATRGIVASYSDYVTTRRTGATRSSSLFANAASISPTDAKNHLTQIGGNIFEASSAKEIAPFVSESTGKPYVVGKAFYELVKPEKVQDYKRMILISKTDGTRFGGDVRRLLGLNASGTVRIRPGDHGNWRIFVQSTSYNRKIHVGTRIFVED